MDVNQELLDQLSAPISGDAPCGINAKYEGDYEQLEAEIAKSQSLSSESTDWDQVLNLSSRILTEISKDFPTACYYAYSLILKHGYQGMLDGFAITNALSQEYWQDMYPPVKRLRGRQNAIQWLIEQTSSYIENKEPSNNDLAGIAQLTSTVKDLDFFLAEKMEDKAPNFADLNRQLKRFKEIAKTVAPAVKPEAAKADTTTATTPETSQPTAQPASAPAPDAVTPNPATEIENKPAETPAEPIAQAKPKAPASKTNSTSSSAMADAITDIQSEQDAKKAFKQVQDTLKTLAQFHAAEKASDPKRFRYSRMALWGSLDKLPPAKDGKTQLPCPPADKLKKVVDLYEAGEFLDAIELAEKSAEKLPYWFDGNRYIVMSLGELGAEYAKAKSALENEIIQFVSRIPKILDLQYANGEPFLSDACKNWIMSLVSPESQSSASNSDALSSSIAEAKALALSGKLNEAFALLNEQPITSQREHFKIKMACAELACGNGQAKVGIPILEHILEDIKSLRVSDWESDFISKALSLLLNAYDSLDEADLASKQQQKDAVYNQLCWYNPALITQ
ncbi:TssA family type VI secretion system protein [Bermanella sp. R86510]|uniref:TssA family type VI secretion system protein n=1 Tax=unclassified Bermanella TaxID=2627862 RepID=UPI0037CACB25